MFIPPKKHIEQLKQTVETQDSKVYLKNNHLMVADEIADSLFSDSLYVYLSFKTDIKKLFLVSNSNEVFRKLHDPSMQMLKSRITQKEKSISLQEILIDNDLNGNDRVLDYEIRDTMKMLVIQF
jgi:hypothetical protein